MKVLNVLAAHDSTTGADNSNNSSYPDTSMKFGKKHPYAILFQNGRHFQDGRQKLLIAPVPGVND